MSARVSPYSQQVGCSFVDDAGATPPPGSFVPHLDQFLKTPAGIGRPLGNQWGSPLALRVS